METRRIVLEKHLKDLWKNKVVRYVRFYFVMITMEKVLRQAQNVVACFFIARKEVTYGRAQNNILP